jgi:hypothetical protein
LVNFGSARATAGDHGVTATRSHPGACPAEGRGKPGSMNEGGCDPVTGSPTGASVRVTRLSSG